MSRRLVATIESSLMIPLEFKIEVHIPSQPIQADRDPHEREPRPLNSDRLAGDEIRTRRFFD